jgi:hypothetical protein
VAFAVEEAAVLPSGALPQAARSKQVRRRRARLMK